MCIVLESNTVSPNARHTPRRAYQGYNNAQAHVDSIVAALALVRLSERSAIVDPTDFTADIELARELLWNEGSFALRDAISDYIIAQPLSITERATATAGATLGDRPLRDPPHHRRPAPPPRGNARSAACHLPGLRSPEHPAHHRRRTRGFRLVLRSYAAQRRLQLVEQSPASECLIAHQGAVVRLERLVARKTGDKEPTSKDPNVKRGTTGVRWRGKGRAERIEERVNAGGTILEGGTRRQITERLSSRFGTSSHLRFGLFKS